MRLTYILAVVIAATLHASGTALTTTKDSTHAAVSNVASKGIVHSLDVTEENDGRMLRKVHPKLGERQPQLGDFFPFRLTLNGQPLFAAAASDIIVVAAQVPVGNVKGRGTRRSMRTKSRVVY
ncbi:hypothetical protein PF011_g29054 [Phytophthora fragariae]|uniref:RxLR effector protein n=1 Tax=Phytophthora fragariae TaxID=53985 RepID=A0A6A3H2X3_9STRA|nr:hypothetical protein PF011_g29054 [Phytophthora fragariae]